MADGVAFRKGNEADAVEAPPSQRSAALRSPPVGTQDSESSSEVEVERITLSDLNPPDGDRVSFSVADRWDRASAPPKREPLGFATHVERGVAVAMAIVGLTCVASIAYTFAVGGGDVVGRSMLAGLGLGVSVGIAIKSWRRHGPAARKADRSRAIVLSGDALILERRFRVAGSPDVDASPAQASEGVPSAKAPRLPIWRMGLQERFGVTLLCSRQGERLVALVTTPTGTFPLATRLTPENELLFDHLVRGSAEISADDNALFAAGPDGQSVVLTPSEFNDFITRLLERDPTCLGRFMLSDQAGRPLLLDDGMLTAQGRQFDLRSPVEWKSIQFQEAFGSAVTYYQGTWVRQGVNEVVFVSLLSPNHLDPLAPPEVGCPETLISPGTVTDPPPLSQRVAMEGFFVGPMRSALRRAPRLDGPLSRQGIVDTRTH